MIIYTILMVIISFLYLIIGKKYQRNNNTSIKVNRKSYILFVSIILTFVLGLRGLTVGIDTLNYYNIFMRVTQLNIPNLFDGVLYEYGFRLLQFLIGVIFGDYQFLLIVVAIFYISVVSYHVYTYSKRPWFSYILFILYGFYTFAFSTTRQTIALGFIMIAYEFIHKRQLLKFILFVLAAASFHVTALVFIPSYWITKFKINKFTFAVLSGLTLLVIYFRSYIFIFLNSIARVEYTAIETGGNLLFLFMIVSVLIGIIYKKRFFFDDLRNKLLFYMMCMSMIIMPITQFHPAIMRLFYYYFIFMIIYIPNLLSAIKDPIIRVVGYSGYILVGILYFYNNVIPSAQLENYLFFWQ